MNASIPDDQLHRVRSTGSSGPIGQPPPRTALIRHMDRLFQAADPWHYRTSAYEARKRAVTLACLPRARYALAFEPGCANGALSEQLARRCDRLLCADASASALAWAREQVSAHAGLEWQQLTVPDQWPQERFDLIVLSEFLYYLDAEACAEVATRCLDSLTEGGTVLACHWRHHADDFLIQGDEAHACLRSVFSRSGDVTAVRAHREPDFLIDVWSRSGVSFRRTGAR